MAAVPPGAPLPVPDRGGEPRATATYWYFAYGSNMSAGVMAECCPGNRFAGIARLEGYVLACSRRSVRTGTGVADVVSAPGHSVWGALYEVTDEDLAALDAKEGNGRAYVRQILPVRREPAADQPAIVYTVRRKEPAPVPPSPEYRHVLLTAARDRGLPEPYILDLAGRLPG